MSNEAPTTWPHLLCEAPQKSHFVQTYQDPAFLADTVSLFISEGLDRGDNVLIVARQRHRELFLEKLRDRGYDPAGRVAQSQLFILDAEELLPQLMRDGMPQEENFVAVVEKRLKQYSAGRGRKLRVQGEMVDLLYQQGNLAGAGQLESFWNHVLKRISFTHLCAYAIDPLQAACYDTALPELCRHHTHLLPVQHESTLETALERALEETLGYSLAGMLQGMSSALSSDTVMPRPQQRLIWLHKNLPGISRKVLGLMRIYYQAAFASGAWGPSSVERRVTPRKR